MTRTRRLPAARTHTHRARRTGTAALAATLLMPALATLSVGCQSDDGTVRRPEPGGLVTRNGPGEPGSLSRALLQDDDNTTAATTTSPDATAEDMRLLSKPVEVEGGPQVVTDPDAPAFQERDLPVDGYDDNNPGGSNAREQGGSIRPPAEGHQQPDASSAVDPEVDALISGTADRSVMTGEDATPVAPAEMTNTADATAAPIDLTRLDDDPTDIVPAREAFDDTLAGIFAVDPDDDLRIEPQAAMAGDAPASAGDAAPKQTVAEVVEGGDDGFPLSPLLDDPDALQGSLDRSNWPRLEFSPAESGVDEINKAWFVSDEIVEPEDRVLQNQTPMPVLQQMNTVLDVGR